MQIRDVYGGAASAASRAYGRQISGAGAGGNTGVIRPAEGRPRTDSVSMSDTRRQVAKVVDLASAQPDVRADRVAELRSQIRSGAYHVNVVDLAAKLMG